MQRIDTAKSRMEEAEVAFKEAQRELESVRLDCLKSSVLSNIMM